MSTITKLNSPDQASQKVSTLIDMVTIRQHYKREEKAITKASHSLRPTVRFADLSNIINSATPSTASDTISEPNAISNSLADKELAAVVDNEFIMDSPLPGDDGDVVTRGNRDRFEVEETD
ncbi:hypothetical protein BDV93DRAFT_516850, partial [Ceratobasidium sp. AG-I]